MSEAVVAQLSLIPDGPLHPDDAVAALIVGVIVGALFGRRPVAAAAARNGPATTLMMRHPGFVPEGLLDRPTPVAAIAGMLVAATLAAAVLRARTAAPVHTTVAAATVACAGVWATAPDTEPALIGGAVLAASTPFLGRAAVLWAPVVVVLPFAAAVLGTMGRPGRLPLVLGVAVAAIVIARLAELGLRHWWGQRAGTPTTAAPGATSSVTTAPAPTTAP